MNLEPHLSFALLLLALLNPFLASLCLPEAAAGLPRAALLRELVRAALISALVFSLFAWGGDALFSEVLQLRLASFQVFSGVLFLVIGLRIILKGAQAMHAARGAPGQGPGAIALPLMIGPGTVSASLLVGARLPVPDAVVVIFATLAISVALVAALRRARLADRYVELAGRVAALLIGTFAVELIFEGIGGWLEDPAPQWQA